MPSTMDKLLVDLGHLYLNNEENEKRKHFSDGENSMKSTFRELRRTLLNYEEKEPNALKEYSESSDSDEDREEDILELVNDYEDTDDEEICVVEKCGKDSKSKSQNRDVPYNVSNRLGGVTQEFAQNQSSASRFFQERQYTKALEWLIDAYNKRFAENDIIEQLNNLRNSIDRNNQNKYSQIYEIFCKPNNEEVTALFFASIHNMTRTSEFLVNLIFDHGFPNPQQAMQYFNKQDPSGNTLLHEMAYVGDNVAPTLAKLFEFRYPNEKHALFNYRILNSSQQSPIHYSLENCLQTSQHQTIDIFHTVDPDILKALDGKGNNLLHCFINSCQKFYPLHASVDSKGLENVKQYLKELLNYPVFVKNCVEINSYGHGRTPMEFITILQPDMEPSIWSTIYTCLEGTKKKKNQTDVDDEIIIINHRRNGQTIPNIQPFQKSGVERSASQEKQTPVVLDLREEKIATLATQEASTESDMIPLFVAERNEEIYTPIKSRNPPTKSRKISRHNAEDDGYITSSPIIQRSSISSPGTSPQASTSAKKYSQMNVYAPLLTYPSHQQSSPEESYTHAQQQNSIPLSVQVMSRPQSTHQSCDYTYSQLVSSPSATTQIVLASSTHPKIVPGPTTYAKIAPSPTTCAKILPTPITYAKIAPTPIKFSQIAPIPTTYPNFSPTPITYANIAPTPTTYTQIAPLRQAYDTLPMVLKYLPETACPDASIVLGVINGTSHAATCPPSTVTHQECLNSYFQCDTCKQTFCTKQQLLSHAEQAHNMTAGKETMEILIDQSSLSRTYMEASGGELLSSGYFDDLLTTNDFADMDRYLYGKELNNHDTAKTSLDIEKEKTNSIPDINALLSPSLDTPVLEKEQFNWSNR